MEVQKLCSKLSSLNLVTIEDFLRFIVAISRNIIDNKKRLVTINLIDIFVE